MDTHSFDFSQDAGLFRRRLSRRLRLHALPDGARRLLRRIIGR